MKKRIWFLLILGIVCAALLWQCALGRRPFEKLTVEEIAEVSVSLMPPNVETDLSAEEIEQLAEALQNVVVYNRTIRHWFSGGQTVRFTVNRTDGSILVVQPYGSVMILDGKAYRTEYTPSEALNQLANTIGKTPWAKK